MRLERTSGGIAGNRCGVARLQAGRARGVRVELVARLFGLSWLFVGGCAVPVEIVAHRGASENAPENTLAAVRQAWVEGADLVEVDIRRTLDGRIVVIHDDDAKRTTGSPAVVATSTFEDLRRLDAGSWKGPRWNGERIPLLEEVLDAVPKGKGILIEVKCGAEVVPDLARAVRSSAARSRVIGFDLDTVAAVKRALPEREVYLLSGWKQEEATGAWTPRLEELIDAATREGLDGLDLSADGPLDAAAVRRIRAAGLAVHVWTVDDPDVARRMRDFGVQGITTNAPARIRAALVGDRRGAP